MRLHVASVLSLALLLGGCGEAESDAPPPPTHTSAVTPSPVPIPAPSAPAPVEPVSPIGPGSAGMVEYRDTGQLYAAVVTEALPGGEVRVVFADGDTRTVSASSVKPDVLAVGMRVGARLRSWPRFVSGRVLRRIGHAVFVEFDDGDRQWTSIGLVRIPADAVRSDAVPASVATPTALPGEPGSTVTANYRGDGRWYAGVVVERRSEDGKLHVIYSDGDNEWLDSSGVRRDTLVTGERADARVRRGGTFVVLTGEIQRRVRHAVEIRFDDGTSAWAALATVRVAANP